MPGCTLYRPYWGQSPEGTSAVCTTVQTAGFTEDAYTPVTQKVDKGEEEEQEEEEQVKVEEQEDGEREETPEEGGREEGVKRG